MYQVLNSNFGWTCPKCGSVYSPMTAECWRCNKKEQITYDVTCNTNALHGEERPDGDAR